MNFWWTILSNLLGESNNWCVLALVPVDCHFSLKLWFFLALEMGEWFLCSGHSVWDLQVLPEIFLMWLPWLGLASAFWSTSRLLLHWMVNFWMYEPLFWSPWVVDYARAFTVPVFVGRVILQGRASKSPSPGGGRIPSLVLNCSLSFSSVSEYDKGILSARLLAGTGLCSGSLRPSLLFPILLSFAHILPLGTTFCT